MAGSYRNPILPFDYSDPDVIRDGEDFFLTASSFNCTPGLPILHSRDLVNWTIVNHAILNNPDPRGVFDKPQHGCGVWAPAIRKHSGRFWIFFPMPDEGIYTTMADDPRGKWSEPHLLVEGKGMIDPCPLWDDDGKAWLIHAYARSRAGIKNRLRIRPMAPDGSKLLGEGEVVYHNPERHDTLEGPKLYKRDGYYYIFAPAGGVKTGYQLILRSRNLFGPYEEKVVLAQGSTAINGPHQGALVDDPSGDWWFVHFQDREAFGRIVHLQPVRWEDDWPLIGINQNQDGCGEPVLEYRMPRVAAQPQATPATSDELEGPSLGLQWQWHANHRPDWCSLAARKGHLRLPALQSDADLAATPNLLLQKLPAYPVRLTASVELHGAGASVQSGVIVMGRQHAALAIVRQPEHASVELLVNNRVVESHPLREAAATLAMDVDARGVCRFSFAEGDDFQWIGEPFVAVAGVWIGAKVGVFCRSIGAASKSFADIDFVRLTPSGSGG